jgi:hypothetical protein
VRETGAATGELAGGAPEPRRRASCLPDGALARTGAARLGDIGQTLPAPPALPTLAGLRGPARSAARGRGEGAGGQENSRASFKLLS